MTNLQFYAVSIRASTREATFVLERDLREPRVSIRASTREATVEAGALRIGEVFQSAPPRGRRPAIPAASRSLARGFNPRLHAGGDPHPRIDVGGGLGFNPRLHAGGDLRATT